jgi:hypothetical protein
MSIMTEIQWQRRTLDDVRRLLTALDGERNDRSELFRVIRRWADEALEKGRRIAKYLADSEGTVHDVQELLAFSTSEREE